MNLLHLVRTICLCGCLPLVLIASTVGCDGEFPFTIVVDAGDANENTNGSTVPEPQEDSVVVVRLVNLSELALDVQLFASTDPTVTTADQLFVEANVFLQGIGFLSLGILAPGEGVDVPIPCEDAVFVGTLGGEFLDASTGESIAAGTTPRLAQLGPQFDCGNRVTFRFFPDDDGQPTAALSIE